MDYIQIIIQAGAVGISLTLIWLIAKPLKDLFTKLINEVSESRKQHEIYIQENNHTTTDLVREATATMAEVREAIKTHNQISQNQNDTLKILLERIK